MKKLYKFLSEPVNVFVILLSTAAMLCSIIGVWGTFSVDNRTAYYLFTFLAGLGLAGLGVLFLIGLSYFINYLFTRLSELIDSIANYFKTLTEKE